MPRKSFVCTLCRKNCRNQYYLGKHMRMEHETKPELVKNTIITRKKIKKSFRKKQKAFTVIDEPRRRQELDEPLSQQIYVKKSIPSQHPQRIERNASNYEITEPSSTFIKLNPIIPQCLNQLGFDHQLRTLNLERTPYDFWLVGFENKKRNWLQFYELADVRKLLGLSETGFQTHLVKLRIGDKIYAPFEEEFIKQMIH